MNSSPLRFAILQPLSPERAPGTQQVDKISVSSENTSSLVLNANLWSVALGSKLSARLPWGAFGLVYDLKLALKIALHPPEGFTREMIKILRRIIVTIKDHEQRAHH